MWISVKCRLNVLTIRGFSQVLLRRSPNRWFSTNQNRNIHHVGIVGSGPAGFYTAQQILKVGEKKKLPQVIVAFYANVILVSYVTKNFGFSPAHQSSIVNSHA